MKRKRIPKKSKKRKPDKEPKHGFASIVIPTVKQTEMVRDCILALKANTGNFLNEIIVVDDGSKKHVQDYLKDLAANENFRLILKDKNEGFGKTCNQGIKEAKGDHIVLLNNDVLVEPGWLKALLKVAERDEKVGIVGARLLYPDGTIQHAGVYFDPRVGFEHRLRSQNKDHFEAIQEKSVIAVTFALVLITRKLINAIGLLEEEFFVSLEDVDYCLRAKEAGFEVIYCPSCIATHLEGGTRGSAIFNKDPYWLKKEIDTIDKFYGKWTKSDIVKKESGLKELISYYERLNTSCEEFLRSIGICDPKILREICG